MELNLQRPLLFFDIESTGLNIALDGIIELSFVKVFPGGETRVKTWKIKPWDYENHCQIPINPQASEVNGVKDEDLVDCPKFIEVLPEVITWLEDSDLAGFNSAKFDLPLLAEEIERVRAYSTLRLREEKSRAKAQEMLACIDKVDLHACKMVDVQNIYHHFEPRNLRAAYRFYCGGKDFENAHTAEADTVATYEVLKSQLDRYSQPTEIQPEVLKNDVDALSKIGARARTIDFAGRLIEGEDGEAVISFGKHKGRTARDIWNTEPSYYAWIEGGDFTLDTKHQFARLKEQFQKERKEFLNRPATSDELESLRSKFSTGKLF
ncbi:MAG: 3'-5' exonuclease [Bacteroidales bacterium]|nr:3'-5' exonuclease [Bacteroidales bacterium]